MLTLEQVKKRIQKMEPVLWSDIINMPEVLKIPQILLQEENIEAVTKGIYQKSSGLVFATNHRILFIDTASCTPFPFASLTSIKYRSSIEFTDGSLLGTLTLQVSGTPVAFNKVPGNGTHFAKRVRSLLESYSPHANVHFDGENDLEAKVKIKKGVFLLLGATLSLCLVFAYLFKNLEDTKSQPTLAVKVDEFSKQWNQAGKELGSPYQLEDLQVVKNENERSFSHYLTENLKIMGTVAENGQLSKLILLGDAERTLPLLTEQSITAVQPNLSPPARQELLKKLELINGNIDKEDRQISQFGIRYSITYSDKLGVIFEAAPFTP